MKVKPVIRKSVREKAKMIYVNGMVVDELKWTKILNKRSFLPYDNVMVGADITFEYIQKNGLKRPILIEIPDGLDMEIPKVTVDEVVKLVGSERRVEPIEVCTQTDTSMSLAEWGAYFRQPKLERNRILNVISLEIGETALGRMIRKPKVVRQLDWIDNVWPRDQRPTEYPRVQLYCLMGVQDSYTDFHVDFGGTSVFYHVVSGEKIFYFVPPTKKNLETYSEWSSSPDQSNTFFGDLVPECYKLHLKTGNTMIVPSGWIHSVFTPVDTIVIGGNFLHTFSVKTQLAIAQIEKDTNVPFKFRFPYFVNMQWYAARKFLKTLKDISVYVSSYELEAIQILVDYLSHLAKRSTNHSKMTKEERKQIRAEVPPELKNLKLLLTSLQKALDSRLNGERAIVDEDGWESDLTEMEFFDSDVELDEFLPEDVPLMTDEEDNVELLSSGSDHKEYQDKKPVKRQIRNDSDLDSDEPPRRKLKIKKKKVVLRKTYSDKTIPSSVLKPLKLITKPLQVVPQPAKLVAKMPTIRPQSKVNVKFGKPKGGVFNRLQKTMKRR